MENIAAFNNEEKILLAGSMKSIILADGTIAESVIEDMNSILKKIQFEPDDFDHCLRLFDTAYNNSDQYFYAMKKISGELNKNLILEVLEELANLEGYETEGQKRLIKRLKTLWDQ